jgi:hypothetical protein
MKNVITFNPTTEECYAIQTYPKPSKKYIPEWYKKIPIFTNGAKKLKYPLDHGMPNVTLKKCVPFLDAMSSGYMVTLEEDVYIEQINGIPNIRWRSNDEVLSWHTLDQIINLPIPDTYHAMVAKWVNNWTISVPKNYSVLFSHPLNRIDLPFFTLSGLVNCDLYPLPVQFPFILKKGFEGIIESGTPICQLTIIKNEAWKTEVLKYDKISTYKNKKSFFKTFIGSYKTNFWSRHSYE